MTNVLVAARQQEVAVDIGQPAVRHGTGRKSAITAQREGTIGPVHPVNKPGAQLRPPLSDDPCQKGMLGRTCSLPLAQDPLRCP
jgi:hypothetical protein